MATLYWAVNSLKMLKDPSFNQLKSHAICFVFSCLKESGGFAPNPTYGENIVSTLNALQILFIYNIPYYDIKTVNFILSLQKVDGAFTFDSFGETESRFDCCAVNSLHLLGIMKKFPNINHAAATKICNQLESLPEIFTENAFNQNKQIESVVKCLPMQGYNIALGYELLSSPMDPKFISKIGLNLNTTVTHLLEFFNSDGGAGQLKDSESHAAQVFCVLSALRSLGCLQLIDRLKTVDFLVYRQGKNGGLCGRVNKKEDACYSFWAYSSMIMLDGVYIDVSELKKFVMECEDENGGFSDRPENKPDLFHLMFSLASLSLMKCEDLDTIDPGFAI